jgi:protein O-mannosyl-transferase
MSQPEPVPPIGFRAFAPAVVLIAAIVGVYAFSLRGAFLWDDDLHITANPTIIGPLGLQEIWTTSRANYFPLVLTNFWVQHALWGLEPLGYRVVTLVFHALAALLLWRVLRQLSLPGAWLGAALWALHPVQVESVAWICELKNTQSAVFFLAAVWFWMKWLESNRN